MNKIFLLFLICFAFITKSQSNKNGAKPIKSNQNVTQNSKAKLSNNTVNNLPYPLLHDTCLDKQFSIVFYVVLDSTYSPAPANTATLSSVIDTINDRFKRICVKFLNCSTVYIPVFPYGKWYNGSVENSVKSTWYTENTINVYVVDSVFNALNFDGEGYTYRPTTTNLNSPKKDVIVISKGALINFSHSFMLHLLGEYFGLPHTFEEINPTPAAVPPPASTLVTSQEFANYSNCSSVVTSVPHGDGFCDTEADPGPAYIYVSFDGMGNPYNLPFDNYMSFYNTRCRFTQEQYNHMARIILTRRMYLH